MNRNEKLLNIAILGPLIATPVLAVEFPRVLAFLPLITALLGFPVLWFGFHTRPKLSRPVLVFTSGVTSIIFLSLIWTNHFDHSFERVIKTSLLLIFYALGLSVIITGAKYMHPKGMFFILIACAIGGALTALDLSLDSALYKWIRQYEEVKSLSTAVFNRGAVSIVLMTVTSLLLMTKKISYINALLVLPVLIMTFMVQSQSAQAALLLGLIFYVVFPFKKAWAWYGLFAMTALFIVGKPFFLELFYLKIPDVFFEWNFAKQAYIEHRLEIWSFANDVVAQSPVFGHGIEATKNIAHQFQNGTQSVLHPHSAVLQIWIEFGLVGILMGVAAIAWMMKYMYHNMDEITRRAALTSFIMIFAVANVTYGVWQGWWLGLLTMLAGVLILSVKMKEIDTSPTSVSS